MLDDAQLPLPLGKPRGPHGGARRGAGRKRRLGRRPNVPHRAREAHEPSLPVLVTLRAVRQIPSLRQPLVLNVVREAILRQQQRRGTGFRVPHFSIQHDHVHMIVEADEDRALRLGLRGFIISLARQVNRVLRRNGRLWADRYHSRELGSPTETFNALVYVLNNDLKHGCRGADPAAGIAMVDPYSSAAVFKGWSCPIIELHYRVAWADMKPRTWMLRHGWAKCGRLDPKMQPGPKPSPRARR